MKKIFDKITSIFDSDSSENAGEQRLYLSGWEVNFDGSEDCMNFIKTQASSKEDAMTQYSALELIFQKGKLAEIVEYEEGEEMGERELKPGEDKFKYIEVPPNEIYQLEIGEGGYSYLGGEIPMGVTTPKFDFVAPIQYLGMLSPEDKAFDWLPYDLHLICPIYLNIGNFYVDYSNSRMPNVFDIDALKATDNSYEKELKFDSEIVFEKTPIHTPIAKEPYGKMGLAGAPHWIQYPDIPKCPKSGKLMKFVCQLSSEHHDLPVARTNVKARDDFYQRYFEHLNFWADGDLFIFFEPESQIACYLIQNT